jgi:phage protein D
MASAPPPSSAGATAFAGFRVTLDGKDLTDRIAPRLLSLRLTEKRGGEADQLDLEIHDHDGAMAIPKTGAVIHLELGWVRGAEVTIGMVNKGRFTVDEAEYGGPPDIITIRARSADLTDGYRVRRERSFKATTLSAIARQVAASNGLEAKVAAELAGIAVPVLEQHQKSDMALIRELGRKHDAVATVKSGKLILSPIGKAATAGGKTIPAATLTRGAGDRYRYARVEREQYAGVEARWHDQEAAERKTVKVGGSTGQARKPKRLKRVYHTAADAKAAAAAEARRITRGAATFDYELGLGRPDLYPERPVALSGWKPEIDSRTWLIAEATHSLDANGGLATSLKLETAG